MCRVGVTGIFCDECAPGYDSEFPACKECHACAGLWTGSVKDVQRATQKMKTFVPNDGKDLQPGDNRHRQQLLEMYAKLEDLGNLTSLSPPAGKKLEKLYLKARKLTDGMDTNVILIDPSPLLNTEIDNIYHEFKKLLNNLKQKVDDDPDREVDEDQEELMDEIQKLHKSFMQEEKRVRNANKALEDSMDTRQEIKHRLSTCSQGDLLPIEKKIKALSAGDLNHKVCGGPGLEDCSGCGGALCQVLGQRKCGGPNCDGVVPLSEKASKTAKQAKEELDSLPVRLQESKSKINDAREVAQDTKDLTKNLQDRISSNIDSFERDKNKTKELLQRVKDYLMDEMVPAEDIEKMARAVLDIKLPRSPDQIRSMIDEIHNLLSNATSVQDDLKNLEDHAKTAKDLLERAKDLKNRTKNIDVTEISRDIYDAERAQDRANNDLETSSQDRDAAKNQIQEIKDKLDDIETKAMSRRPAELLDAIEALKNKTQQNRDQARSAREVAEAARNQSDGAQAQLDDVLKQFDLLTNKSGNQTLQDGAAEQLKKLMDEAEDMKRQVEDKMRLIEGLETKIQELIRRKEERESEVASLLQTVDSLRKEIAERAEGYVSCTS